MWGSGYKYTIKEDNPDDGEWVCIMRTCDKILAPIGTLNLGVFIYIFWFIDYDNWMERYLYSALILLPVLTYYIWILVRLPLPVDDCDKPVEQKD